MHNTVICRLRDNLTDEDIERDYYYVLTDGQTDIQTDRQTNWIDKQTIGQTNSQT